MQIALSTLNAKYIHPNMALRILGNDLKRHDINYQLKEFSIKEDLNHIIDYLKDFDIIALSCYIFNIKETKYIINELKTIKPNIIIILGGPEVTYLNNEEALKLACDYIICGEGEIVFTSLIKALLDKVEYFDQSIIYNNDNLVMNTKVNEVSLDYTLPLINDISGLDYENQIVYLETSRGCPYLCSYCLASLDNNVRNFPLDHVYAKIDEVLSKKVRMVKFLDRTFNFDPLRTDDILNYIIKNDNGYTTFQLEVTGELLNLSAIDLIKSKARSDLFRFEIGIQSTNKIANQSIRRYQDFTKLSTVIKALNDSNKVVLHLDLIAGLPFEDLDSFKNTFNDVFKLEPMELQLGMLKLLKGTHLNELVVPHEYLFDNEAPYSLIKNKYLSVDDLDIIEDVEHGLNTFYNNAHQHDLVLYLINKYYSDAFEFFKELGHLIKHKMQVYDQYKILITFLKDEEDYIKLYDNYYRHKQVALKRLSDVVNKKAVLHQLIEEHQLVQNEVFNNAKVEQIKDNYYFVYLKQQYYIVQKQTNER